MKAKPVAIALASCLLTLAAVLLVLNLGTGEKKIERQLEREYATQDAQFRRAMGALLGPPIVEGNKAEVLLNGDGIFPAMLKAIQGPNIPSRSKPTSTGRRRSAANSPMH